MQALLASLVISMGVKDAAFQAGMRTARAEAKRTEQDFDKSGKGMAASIDRAAHKVNEAAVRIVDSVQSIGREVKSAGLLLTAGLTLPTVAIGAASKEAASDFQAAMNNVHAAMLDASPEQLNKLREAALLLGPAMGKSAIEAAGAIESLAKNGMSAASILGGGLEAALKLGVAGQAELGSAADATTDILQQFHLSASDLPKVVDKVSGALDASKLSFDGYKDAIGQVGGIAGGLGYQFEDMNAALAAVIPLMTGGSDAGTSFKTFLLSLVPASKDAERTMEKLGISFFNADGSMKSLGEVAEVLNTRLAGLSARSRQDALTRMFGTDGMRVAIALMQAGAKGIDSVKASIDKASVDQKLGVLLQGEAASTQRLAAAWEKLKIAIGEAGLIQVLTWVKDSFAAVIDTVASAPPAFFYLVTAAGLAAASLGPLVLIGTKLLPLFVVLILRGTALGGTFGLIGTAAGALLNPVGFLVALLGRLLLAAGASTVVGSMGVAMLRFAGPVGLAVTALSILLPLLFQQRQASAKYASAMDAASTATANSADIVQKLAFAQGEARKEALALARADRVRAIEAVKAARADLQAARAASMRARAASTSVAQKAYEAISAGSGDWERSVDKKVLGFFGFNPAPNRDQAAADYAKAAQVQAETLKRFDMLDKAIDAAEKGTGATRDVKFEDGGGRKSGNGRSSQDIAAEAARNEAQYQDELGQMRVAKLQAEADLTGGIEARYKADMAALEEERASFVRQSALDEGLTAAKRAQLLAAKDSELASRRAGVERDRSNALEQQNFDLAAAENDRAQERLRAEIDLADNAADRRDGELRLLDLQREREEAELDLILATKSTASAEWDNARKRKEMLDEIYADRRTAIERQTEGPADRYMREINRSNGAIAEDIEAIKVDSLKDLNRELADAIVNSRSLGDVFVQTGKRIVSALLEIALQQALIKPLAGALFGAGGEGGGAGGGGFAGLLGGLSGLFGGRGGISAASVSDMLNKVQPVELNKSFGGFRKNGGPITPNEWFVVGEDGPEIFAPGTSGTVIPNGGLRASRQQTVVQMVVDEGQMFEPRVTGISGNVSVRTVRQGNRASALRQRQRLA
ncbi:phage tail tape measure protein [uncultured Sphingomonas sp.]|uniref:phage tail tape measure protein n=1 Tax=uncultured Sphingomonas sp. TaxID=158754 RepID=UPI0025FE9226|nr:phage tail tape measure protein [uncultured Sphingomonas sp.]